jgi:release factor glutamine methyltransferase
MTIQYRVQSNGKLHRILRQEFQELFPTKQLTKQSFMAGKVKCLGKIVPEQQQVRKGMVITIETTIEDIKRWRANLNLEVLLETKHYGIVWKEAGIPALPLHNERNVQDAAIYHLNGVETTHCIHPIQKSSMGLVIVAKNSGSAEKLNKLWESRNVVEKWRLICQAPVKDELDESMYQILDRTPSKHSQSGVLLTVDCKKLTGADYDIRKEFMDLKAPIVGNSKRTVPIKGAKGRGNYEALIGIEFCDPFDGKSIQVVAKEPEKFAGLRERELIGWNHMVNDLTITFDAKEKRSGIKRFFGLDFRFNEQTMIPRNASEVLVRTALEMTNKHPRKVLDMGTGTGVLLLSYLKNSPLSSGIGIDISPACIEIAQFNATQLHLESKARFLNLSFSQLNQLDEPIDLVLCNPPYLTPTQKRSNATAMERDPDLAIVAGDTGYESYAAIAEALYQSSAIQSDALILMEIGHGMASKVISTFEKNFEPMGIIKDSHGCDRCCVFSKR